MRSPSVPNLDSMSSDPTVIHPAFSAPQPKRRRRWWVYVLWIFGSLAALVIALIVSAFLYWNHLVKTYTTTTAKELPAVETNDALYSELQERWDAYALLFIRRSQPIPPFELTGQELNLFARKFGPFRKHAFAEVLPDRLRLQFSVPLDESRNESLRGRFLNGVATFIPVYTNAHLSLRLDTAEANNKPLPRWIQNQLRRANWGEALNRRPEFDLAIRALEKIELRQDRIILHPLPSPAPR